MKLGQFVTISLALLAAPSSAFAAVKNIRVVWDNNPSSDAVIGFTRDGTTSSAQYVKYGATTNEASWATNSTVATRTFKSTLVNYFVRLEGLSPNTEYFFKACDNSGCSPAYMFKTAPAVQAPLTFITGVIHEPIVRIVSKVTVWSARFVPLL